MRDIALQEAESESETSSYIAGVLQTVEKFALDVEMDVGVEMPALHDRSP